MDQKNEKILLQLEYKKNALSNELKVNKISDDDLKTSLIEKIDETFEYDQTLSDASHKHALDIWKYSPDKISDKNAIDCIKFLSDNKLVNKKITDAYTDGLKSDPRKTIMDIREVFRAGIELEQLNHYLFIFDLRRSKIIDELKKKMQMIEESTKNLKVISNVFGRFWDLTIHDLYKMDISIIQRLHDLLAKKDFIQKIAELLGRLASSQRDFEEQIVKETILVPSSKKSYSSPENTTGVKFGNNIPIVLPHQLAMRHNKQTNLIFKMNFIEKKLLELDQNAKLVDETEVTRTERKFKEDSKGPFILCIDTSGSMHGEPENIAKAMAMAIVKIANRDKRKCHIINFSNGIYEFDATNISRSFNDFYNFLSHSFSGGTDVEPALEAAVKKVQDNKFKNADVIIISDFIINRINSNLESKINKTKSDKVRYHALSIGSSQIRENTFFFDNNWVYDGTQQSINKIINDLNKIREE